MTVLLAHTTRSPSIITVPRADMTGRQLPTTDHPAPMTGPPAPTILTDNPTGLTMTTGGPPTGLPRTTTDRLLLTTKRTLTPGPFTTTRIVTKMTTGGLTLGTGTDLLLPTTGLQALTTDPATPMIDPPTPTRDLLIPTTGPPPPTTVLPPMTHRRADTSLRALTARIKSRLIRTTTDPLAAIATADLLQTMTGPQAVTTGPQPTTTDPPTTITDPLIAMTGPLTATTDRPVIGRTGTTRRLMTSTGPGPSRSATTAPTWQRTPRPSSSRPSPGLCPSTSRRRNLRSSRPTS